MPNRQRVFESVLRYEVRLIFAPCLGREGDAAKLIRAAFHTLAGSVENLQAPRPGGIHVAAGAALAENLQRLDLALVPGGTHEEGALSSEGFKARIHGPRPGREDAEGAVPALEEHFLERSVYAQGFGPRAGLSVVGLSVTYVWDWR